ncbi:MAG: 2,3-bisphosphoglycerate-independent phosphoglycerate mutase, partial [Candidatus Baltobacteraceae bacterium]
MTYRPVVLCILDGWGCREALHGNAIAAASTPHWNAYFAKYPWTMVEASGEEVGLPKGIMGNSEVGHLNLGSGRVVRQGVTVIDADIAGGNFAANATLQACIAHVQQRGGTLHFMGLLSDGKVHSSIDHLLELLSAAHACGAPLAVHAFLDGRDTPPRSAAVYIGLLQSHLDALGQGSAVRTVTGRFYAMDRDKRWERTQAAYDAIALADAPFSAASALEALQTAYERGENDEFVQPSIIGAPRPMHTGDAAIFFNFRPDRARQLTLAFSDPSFSAFPVRTPSGFIFATMTKYDETFANPVLFGPRPQYDTFGDTIAQAGLTQLRLAETEKYAHVTYFFNGGREEQLPAEDRKLIPSDRSVATYDLAPQMRAAEITDYAIAQIRAKRYDVMIVNYANADMVGHTGMWQPTIASVEVLDRCVNRLSQAVLGVGGLLAITADHGNAEEKIDKDGNPLTAHTTNPV